MARDQALLGGDGRSFIVRTRRPYAPTNQRTHQASPVSVAVGRSLSSMTGTNRWPRRMCPASEPAEIRPLIVKTVILQAALERSMSSAAMPPWLSNDAPNQLPNASQPSAQVATRWPSNWELFTSVGSMPNAKPSVRPPAMSKQSRSRAAMRMAAGISRLEPSTARTGEGAFNRSTT